VTIREQAILICAVAASAEWPPLTLDRIVRDLDANPAAGDLADEAWLAAPTVGSSREIWAEAECMLREGWSPVENL
jgi:hypothetical protein